MTPKPRDSVWFVQAEEPMCQASILVAGVLNSVSYGDPLLVTGGRLTVVGFLQFGTLGRTAAVEPRDTRARHARGRLTAQQVQR